MKCRFFGALLLLTVACSAAFEVQIINASTVALGSIASLYPGSLNPACLLQDGDLYLRADYSRLFGLTGLDYYQAKGLWKFHKQRQIGFGIHNFGNQIYQEKTLGIRYGQSVQNVLTLGVALDLYHVMITGCENSTAVGLSFGSVWKLGEKIDAALLLQNVNSPAIYGNYDPLPECFLMGIRYTPLPQVELCGEIFKDTLFPFAMRMGTILRPLQFLDLKFGVQLNPDRYSGGLALHLKGLSIDIAYQHHQVLPYTLYYGIGYGF